MANKLLNVRMNQEMIEDLKKVCGELEISVTDAIKLFSNKLIKERTLPVEEKKEEENEDFQEVTDDIIKEMLDEMNETGSNDEGYIQLHNELSEILSFYCKEFGNLVESTIYKHPKEKTIYIDFKTPFSEIAKTFKEKYEEELKNKILDKMIKFYENSHRETLEIEEQAFKMAEEERKKEKKVENDKYIDVMENLKNENPDLYKKLLNQYSYNINYYDVNYLDCESYSDAKKKLEEFLTPEEIKEYYTFHSEMKNCKTEEEKQKLIENIKKDENRAPILRSSINKFKEYGNKKNSQTQSETNNNSEEK